MTDQTIALVTGATRGLGHATALGLARRGAHVIALARTTGALEELAEAIDATPGSSTLVPLDITDDGGLARMCRAIHDRWGRLDLLVHCAAHAAPLSMADHVTEKDFDRCMAVNAKATQRLIFMCAPLLRAASAGHAVFATDGHAGEPFYAAYGASKAAARAIAESWAVECKSIGPKVTLFRPEPMPTGLRARFHPGEDREALSSPADQAERLLALV